MALEERVPRSRGIRLARAFAMAWAALACGLFLGCGQMSHSGTEVPDPTDAAVVGHVQGVDGQPAVAARVIAWGGQAASQAAQEDPEKVYRDTQYTDGEGRFAFSDKLAPGLYDFYFEDPDSTVPEESRPVQRLSDPASAHGHVELLPVSLAPPIVLIIVVKDQYTHDPIEKAVCSVEPTPYPDKSTGEEGITNFYLPPGSYEVTCTFPWSKRTVPVVVPKESSSVVTTIYLTPNGESSDPLPAPARFDATYDENSGVVDMTWSSITNPLLFGYGIRRQDSAQGGPPEALTTQQDTSFRDVPFARTDTEQFKKLLYSVNSLKREPGGSLGLGRPIYVELIAKRPWAYGPRIDSLVPLDSLGAYHVGDTVRIAAAWTNRIRENDSLFWRVTGTADLAEARAHPAASGKDTLAFVLPATGDFKVSLTILDAEGYRSSLTLPLRF